MVESITNLNGRSVSVQANFKLSRSVMTVVYDIAGHEEWLRLRQVCRLFDDASYNMSKSWPASTQRSLKVLNEEEKEIMGSEGLLEIISQIDSDIQENYNKVVKNPDMKTRIVEIYWGRKPCLKPKL